MINNVGNGQIYAYPNYKYNQRTQRANNLTTPTLRFRGGETLDITDYQQQNKKGKLSTGAKITIGLGTAITAVVVGAIAIARHETKLLQKLYKEKLIPKVFDKELKFTEAKTKNEALKYAKDVLGVQNFNESITLDALNYANKGITDVVNKNIGQEVFIPKSYLYDDLGDSAIAHVVQNVRSKDFGELAINKKFFDDENLTKKLDEYFNLRDFAKKAKETTKTTQKAEKQNGLHAKWTGDKELVDLQDRYFEAANNLSAAEKRILYYSITKGARQNALYRYDFVKFVENHKDILKLDIEELKKLPWAKQLNAITKYVKDNNLSIEYKVKLPKDDGLSTIYHEMGHLQDFAKNLKELDLKSWKFPTWAEAKAKVDAKKAGKEIEDRIDIREVDNRWDGTTYEGYNDLLKNNPEKFKKLYPDLYKHVTDENIISTTRKVSVYATTSIGEFIAEVYKKMIKGEPIPEDVLKLYKQYNGPLPNGFQ